MIESYDAISEIPQPSLQKLRAASGNYPRDITMLYLQYPALDPRVAALARQVTAESQSDYTAPPSRAIPARKLRLHASASRSHTRRPIANFLFVRKRGHCEYFASSMAIMLRTLGIPSRLVNGFRNGEYNDLTGSYIVRARNAHTWVEAYISGVGWTSFDPTPSEAAPVATTWSRFRLYLDAAQEFWREWVINYDFGHQRELTLSTVTKAQHTAFDLRRWLRLKYMGLLRRARKLNDRVTHDPRSWGALLVALVLVVVGLWNCRLIVRALRRRSIARQPSRAPQIAASIWYSKMLKRVARQGYFKTPAQTPSEFVNAIPEAALRNPCEVHGSLARPLVDSAPNRQTTCRNTTKIAGTRK